jgi:hypothetical protein
VVVEEELVVNLLEELFQVVQVAQVVEALALEIQATLLEIQELLTLVAVAVVVPITLEQDMAEVMEVAVLLYFVILILMQQQLQLVRQLIRFLVVIVFTNLLAQAQLLSKEYNGN